MFYNEMWHHLGLSRRQLVSVGECGRICIKFVQQQRRALLSKALQHSAPPLPSRPHPGSYTDRDTWPARCLCLLTVCGRALQGGRLQRLDSVSLTIITGFYRSSVLSYFVSLSENRIGGRAKVQDHALTYFPSLWRCCWVLEHRVKKRKESEANSFLGLWWSVMQ